MYFEGLNSFAKCYRTKTMIFFLIFTNVPGQNVLRSIMRVKNNCSIYIWDNSQLPPIKSEFSKRKVNRRISFAVVLRFGG